MSNISKIALTNSELRNLILALGVTLREIERLKPQGYQDALEDIKALLARLELKLNANGG